MVIVTTIDALKNELKAVEKSGKKIGFIPTMGALHNGHLSLIELAKSNQQFTVCSIFVNPTQFNNPADLEKYPRTVEADLEMLESIDCNLVFLPTGEMMYPENEKIIHYDLGELEHLLEGKYRPGHYQGVCRIVDKFLSLLQPDDLYLGQKDFQQCMVIAKMIELRNHKTNLIIGSTLREKSGLAMSSRNMRLTENQKEIAANIFKELSHIKQNIQQGNVESYKLNMIENLEKLGFKVDYVSIARQKDLKEIESWDGEEKIVVLMAAYLGEIRLIDNLPLN